MQDVMSAISSRYASLTSSEQRVAAFVRDHAERVAVLSLAGLAEACGVSDTTVLRTCRTLGFSGYQDFKLRLVNGLLRREAPMLVWDAEGATERPYARYRQRLATDIEMTLDNLDKGSVRRCADGIVACQHVTVVGLGNSGGVAKSLASALVAIGVRSTHLVDRVDIECLADVAGDRDVVIGVSHSGTAPEVAFALERCRTGGALTVALTNFDPSPVADAAEVVLLTYAPETLLGSAACHPRVLEFIVLEQLVSAVASKLAGVARA